MFEQEYSRKLNHNYLILKGTENTVIWGYELKMLFDNKIKGLLPLHICNNNEVPEFYYEINGMQTLDKLFEGKQVNFIELKEFLFGFYEILKSAEEYLINVNHLILKAQYIYIEDNKKEMAFVFHPDYNEDSKESFRVLAEFILNCIDHRDKGAVMLAYQLYKESRKSNFIIEEILELSQQNRNNSSQHVETEAICAAVNQDMVLRDVTVPYITGDLKQESLAGKKDAGNSQSCREQLCKKEKRNRFWLIEVIILVLQASVIGLKINHLLPLGYYTFILLIGMLAVTGMAVAVWECIKVRKKSGFPQSDVHTVEILEKEEIQSKEEMYHGSVKSEEAIHIVQFLSEPSAEYGTGSENEIEIPECKKRITGVLEGKKVIYELSRFPFTVGSLGSCVDMELKDPAISEIHASFTEKENIVYIEDLNTWHGTYVNNIRLKERKHRLQAGDEIKFAHFSFIYQE